MFIELFNNFKGMQSFSELSEYSTVLKSVVQWLHDHVEYGI